MPMPYSHYVLAQRIAEASNLPVEDESAYLVGAFMPDIRYFSGFPRERSHVPVSELESYHSCEDVSLDFLLGYKVHLLIDEVWEEPELKEAYRHAFPPLIRKRMTRGLQALAFELYCLKQPVEVVKLEPLQNSLTKELGVEPSHTEAAVGAMGRYLEQHDLAAALAMAQEAKLFPEERLRTVEGVVRRMQNPLVRAIVNSVIASASRSIFPRVVTAVVERLQPEASSKALSGSSSGTVVSR